MDNGLTYRWWEMSRKRIKRSSSSREMSKLWGGASRMDFWDCCSSNRIRLMVWPTSNKNTTKAWQESSRIQLLPPLRRVRRRRSDGLQIKTISQITIHRWIHAITRAFSCRLRAQNLELRRWICLGIIGLAPRSTFPWKVCSWNSTILCKRIKQYIRAIECNKDRRHILTITRLMHQMEG